MNKFIFGALAFATGVLVEKKFGVTARIMNLASGNGGSVELPEDDSILESDPLSEGE